MDRTATAMLVIMTFMVYLLVTLRYLLNAESIVGINLDRRYSSDGIGFSPESSSTLRYSRKLVPTSMSRRHGDAPTRLPLELRMLNSRFVYGKSSSENRAAWRSPKETQGFASRPRDRFAFFRCLIGFARTSKAGPM